MLADTMIREYDEKGFLILRDLFTVDEVAFLRDDAAILRTPKRGNPDANVLEKDGETVRAAWAVEKDSDACAQTYRMPQILGPVQQLLGERVYLYQSRLNYKAAEKGDIFQWHQDYASWAMDGVPRGGHRDMLTVLVLIDESTKDNGPLRFIPGSHKKGMIDPFYDTATTSYPLHIVPDDVVNPLLEQSGFVECIGPAGTVVMFCGNLVHSSTENHSPAGRRNLYFAYNRDDNRPVLGQVRRKHANKFIMNDDAHVLKPLPQRRLMRHAA